MVKGEPRRKDQARLSQTIMAGGAGAASGSLERELAFQLASLRETPLPPALVERAKLLILDSFGVLAGAATSPAVKEVADAIGAWESAGRATVLLNGRPASPASAALANGTAAHALDFDDQHDPARIHTLCTVLPAVLAAAEDAGGLSGGALLRAVIVGAEFSSRLGLCCYRSLEHGCHPTAALGTLAAAAAAGTVYGLGPDQMLGALSLAFVQMGGTTQSNADGALSKRMGAGFAARGGVWSAHLARHGLAGPHRFLEGEAGLFRMYQRSDVRPDALLAQLGHRWEMADVSLKPFPCCRASHASLQIALELHGEGIRPEDIEGVDVHLGKVNHLMVGGRFSPEGKNAVVHAQFNLAYGFAEALRTGSVTLRTFQRSTIEAADRAAIDRVRCIESSDIDQGSVAGVKMDVRLRSGASLQRLRTRVKGSPDEPMTREETIRKFRDCVEFGTGASRARTDRFIDCVLRLEDRTTVATLVNEFPRASAS